jgi:restriction system protein
MAVPPFQAWFLPLLKRLGDGQVHRASDLFPVLADDLGLSEEDRLQRLASGRQRVYENRIHWARAYFKAAGLLASPARGQMQITERGREVLAENPTELNVRYLRRFPEFVAFHSRSSASDEPAQPAGVEAAEETPEETLARLHRELNQALAVELLDRIKSASPQFFENLVVDLMVAMGYGGTREDAGSVIGKSGDGGVDGVIKEDRLGLDVIYLQAKRWEGSVSRPTVQAFAGSLEGVRARKGVLITTSDFTKEARDYVTRIEKKIVLISGEDLAELMIRFGLGVTTRAEYSVRAVDGDYFELG